MLYYYFFLGYVLVKICLTTSAITCSPGTYWSSKGYCEIVSPGYYNSGSFSISPLCETAIYAGSAACNNVSAALVSFIAGSLTGAGEDGPATVASFLSPIGVAVDSNGIIYVSDSEGAVRAATAAGYVTNVAGAYGLVNYKDGVGTDAHLSSPFFIVADTSSGYLFAADGNGVRKINPTTRQVTTLTIWSPGIIGITLYSNIALYATDRNCKVLRIAYLTGVVSPISNGCGSTDGTGTQASFAYPGGLCISSSGIIYIADKGNSAVRKMTTDGVVTKFAGSYILGFADGTVSSAKFNSPYGVVVTSDDVVFVSDMGNCAIRMISTLGIVTTIAGNGYLTGTANGYGTNSLFVDPTGLALSTDSRKLYVVGLSDLMLRSISIDFVSRQCEAGNIMDEATGQCILSPAGYFKPSSYDANYYICNSQYYSTAGATSCSFCPYNSLLTYGATSCTCPAGSYAVNETCVVAPAGYYVATAGSNLSSLCASAVSSGAATCFNSSAYVTSVIGGNIVAGSDGIGTHSYIGIGTGIVLDSQGQLYVADYSSHIIKRINTTGYSNVFVGGGTGSLDGVGTNAQLTAPMLASSDPSQTIFYWTFSSGIKRITTSGVVTTFLAIELPRGVAWFQSELLYVTSLHRVYLCSNVSATLIAGRNITGSSDGIGSQATFNAPSGIAVSGNQVIYVADWLNHAIRQVLTTGEVTVFAGTKTTSGFADGPVLSALFNRPLGIAVDTSGVLFVTDAKNNAIRMISGGIVTTIAGNSAAGRLDGLGTSASFNSPSGILLTNKGNLFVGQQAAAGVRLVVLTGDCGNYYHPTGADSYCASATAGYFKRSSYFDFNTYICDEGTYSADGATSCASCSWNAMLGSTQCNSPTSQPTSQPSSQPSKQPSSRPSSRPSGHPSAQPSSDPSAQPTSQPTLLLCKKGTYLVNGNCKIAPDGFFSSANNAVSVFACGSAKYNGSAICKSTKGYVSTLAGGGSGSAGVGGIGTNVNLGLPKGIAIDTMGTVYVADAAGCDIKSITKEGVVSIFAGQFGLCDYSDGVGTNALMMPWALAVDDDRSLYVGESNAYIRRVSSTGVVSTIFIHTDGFLGLAMNTSSDILYATDNNNKVLAITTTGLVNVVAGSSTLGYSDGVGSNVIFNGVTGIALKASNTILVTDTSNCVIRSISTSGVSKLVSGVPGTCGYADGLATNALLDSPTGIVVSSAGDVYIADGNNRFANYRVIRTLTTAGVLRTVAGGTAASGDGFGTSAGFGILSLLAISSTFTLYASDSSNMQVRIIDPAGYCPSGYYYASSTGTCVISPAGYYKPRLPLSDNYYICGPSYFSHAGASVCSFCPTSTSLQYGSSFCLFDPTSEPSSQPSGDPSRRPSARPSPQPSSHPSSQPSLSPTDEPSALPTIFPSSAPSPRPSAQPSSSPSSSPSVQPSKQPSGCPTVVPSIRPTLNPSTAPSTFPSSMPTTPRPTAPSSFPTAQPSCVPTRFPSSHPTSQPIGQPSSRPSTYPSGRPSVKPTSQPSHSPTQQPSSRPSARPSTYPSALPSHRPTTNPSVRPSSRPSCHPSSQPSLRPSAFPTNVPSSRPSSEPTSSPTNPSSRPTATPSASPTYSSETEWLNRLSHLVSFHPDSLSQDSEYYADVFVAGKQLATVRGGCAAWNQFTYNVALRSTTQKLIQFEMLFDSDSVPIANLNSSCSNIDSLNSLQTVLSNGLSTTMAASCAGMVIQSSSCAALPTWCLNCQNDSSANFAGLFSPCSVASTSCPSLLSDSGIDGTTESFARLIFAKFEAQSAPIVQIIETFPSRDSIIVSLEADHQGQVYCSAFRDIEPTSAQQVILSEFSSVVNKFQRENITISGLAAATNYSIYCAGKSNDGMISSFEQIKLQKYLVATICCKRITVKFLSKSLLATEIVNPIATIQVDYRPSIPIELTILGRHQSASTNSMFFPDTIRFSSSSSAFVSVAYRGSSATGVYNISIDFASVYSAAEYEVVFSNGRLLELRSSSESPASPRALSAQLSDDGASIVLLFDSKTDKGLIAGVPQSSTFPCSYFLVFVGANSTNCQWDTSSTALLIFPGSTSSVSVNGTIGFVSGKLRVSCPLDKISSASCRNWPTISNTTLAVLSPRSPIVPTVVLSMPATIGSCDSLQLFYGGSIGSAGKAWSVVNISVITNSPNAINISNFLSLDRHFGGLLTIPSAVLPKGASITFSVTLCNWLGACSQGMGSVSVLNMMVPTAIIIEGSSLNTRANSTFQLTSRSYYPSCDGSKSTQYLIYKWTARVVNGTQSYPLTLLSQSKDPSKFVVSAFQLQPSQVYFFTLSVSSPTVSPLPSTATIAVYVLPSNLVAFIVGGSQQSARANSEFILDGSQSYDCDQPSFAKQGLQSLWSCYSISPQYASNCSVVFQNSSAFVLTAFAPKASLLATSIVSLTVFDATRQSSIDITLRVIPSQSPLVSIATSFLSKVSVSSAVRVQGKVETALAALCTWDVDDTSVNLVNASVVPVRKQVAASSVSDVYLSLLPNTLPAGVSLTFSLSCESTGGANVVSSVSVLTNSPPALGTCQVLPPSGQSVSTYFSLVASSWFDSDVPLSFQFGFLSPITSTKLIIQSKSALTVAQTFLSSGSFASNYSLSTVFEIFDSLGAVASSEVVIRVIPAAANATVQQRRAVSMLEQAVGNADLLKQSVSIIGSDLHTVDCSKIGFDCWSLNRASCSSMANTCGECLNGFVGNRGNSNEMCIAVEAISSILDSTSTICASSDECGPWHRCDVGSQKCVVASKTCGSNCSGHGQCVYVDALLSQIDDCTIDDPTCSVSCRCATGYFGVDCSMDSDLLEMRQNITSKLINGLHQIISLESPNEQTLAYWTDALNLLLGDAIELSSDSVYSAANITRTILTSITEYSLSYSAAAPNAPILVDKLLSWSLVSSSRRLISRKLSSGMSADLNGLLLDELSRAVSHDMLSGETPVAVIASTMRFVASIVDAGQNLSITVPSTSLETATGRGLQGAVGVTNGAGAVGISPLAVTSLPLGVMEGLDAVDSISSLTATAFRLFTSVQSNNSNCNATDLQLTFIHHTEEHLGVVDNQTDVFVETQCKLGVDEAAVAVCPFGLAIPVHCDGSKDYVVETLCPKETREPTCLLYQDSVADAVHCRVVNYSSTATICSCSSCELNTLALREQSSQRYRRLSGGSLETRGSNAITLAASSFTEYASVVQSAASFNSMQALRSTMIVSITFASLWFGALLLLFGCDQLKQSNFYYNKSRSKRMTAVNPTKASAATSLIATLQRQWSQRPDATANSNNNDSNGDINVAPKHAAIENMSLEDCLKDYIGELFSPAYSNESDRVRFLRELFTKHVYLSIFFKEASYEQWVQMFYLLTSLTTNFFLLALFYDIQFPSDDGSCQTYATEADCIAKTSLFNSEQTKCIWKPYPSVSAAEEVEGICQWRSVQFDFFTSSVVTVVVLVVSVPISFLLSSVCELVLLAPSRAEMRRAQSSVRVRRASAVMMMNDQQLASLASHSSNAGIAQHESSIANANTAANKNKEPNRFDLFSSVQDIEFGIRRASSRAHQLSFRSMSTERSAAKATAASRAEHYKSLENFMKSLSQFYATKQSLRSAERETQSLLDMGNIQLLAEFDQMWRPLLTGEMHTEDEFGRSCLELARTELDAVVKEADKWIEQLKHASHEQVGVQILQLFVRDCLGPHSREAKIFSQKVNPFRLRYVLNASMKGLAFVLLVCLNIYFIFSCMLYGRDKGIHWQRGWLYTCVVNLFVDVFINAVTIASVIHYLVPSLILQQARNVKASVTRIIQQLCSSKQLVATSKFSVTSYFFISSHVARAFPDLLESRIVLSNRSFVLSKEQMLRINPDYESPSSQASTGLQQQQQQPQQQRHPLWYRLAGIIGMWLTTWMLIFGSQSTAVQENIIALFNPGLVSIMAFLGLAVARQSVYGIIAGVVMVALLAVLCYYLGLHYIKHYQKQLRKDKKSSRSTPTLNNYELDFFDFEDLLETDTDMTTPSQSRGRSAGRHQEPGNSNRSARNVNRKSIPVEESSSSDDELNLAAWRSSVPIALGTNNPDKFIGRIRADEESSLGRVDSDDDEKPVIGLLSSDKRWNNESDRYREMANSSVSVISSDSIDLGHLHDDADISAAIEFDAKEIHLDVQQFLPVLRTGDQRVPAPHVEESIIFQRALAEDLVSVASNSNSNSNSRTRSASGSRSGSGSGRRTRSTGRSRSRSGSYSSSGQSSRSVGRTYYQVRANDSDSCQSHDEEEE